jgi:hypothetical protein
MAVTVLVNVGVSVTVGTVGELVGDGEGGVDVDVSVASRVTVGVVEFPVLLIKGMLQARVMANTIRIYTSRGVLLTLRI